MFTIKCDVCKKNIKSKIWFTVRQDGENFGTIHLCDQCGKPVSDFLKKHKLPEE